MRNTAVVTAKAAAMAMKCNSSNVSINLDVGYKVAIVDSRSIIPRITMRMARESEINVR